MEKLSYIDELVSHGAETKTYVKAYLEKQIALQKSELAEKSAIAAGSLSWRLAGIVLAGMILLFCSIALSIYLGDVFESAPLGYLSVAGIYLLLLILVYLFRNKAFNVPIQNKVIDFFYKPKAEKYD